MKFAFTPFDKAILAAILGPLIVLGTNWVNGSPITQNDLIAAAVAAVVAGLSVYFKGNASPAVVPPKP